MAVSDRVASRAIIIMSTAPLLSPVPEDEATTVHSQRTDWDKVTDPIQLELGRRAAKAAHTRARKAVADCVKRRGSAVELRDLHARVTREFDEVVKRHERLLLFANLDEEDLEEHDDWLRLVRADHEKALESIPFDFDNLDY